MEPRIRYKELLEQGAQIASQLTSMYEQMNVTTDGWDPFIDFCHCLLRDKFPKSWTQCLRKNAPKVLEHRDPELYAVAKAAMVRGFQFRYRVLTDDQEQLKKARGRLVEAGLRPLAGDVRVKLREVYESTYSTQGYGARKYAEGSATLTVLEARALGIKTEIVITIKEWDGVDHHGNKVHHELATFHIWVDVEDECDAQIIKQCPVLTLREQVKACWKAGIQPRVYAPFLPHGYEESVGLDFFGNEVKKEKSA